MSAYPVVDADTEVCDEVPVVSGPDPLALLSALVKAHDVPMPRTGSREPILFIRLGGGDLLQHHGLPPEGTPDADEAVIEELHAQGLISITYNNSSLLLVPTRAGRKAVEEYARAQLEEPEADVAPLLAALSAQVASANPLAWPVVRPVLASLRDYWAAGRFLPHGILVRPVMAAVPDGQIGLFTATLRALIQGDYLRIGGSLGVNDLPAEIQLTDRARSILDGWPGAAPDELVENLLAVLAEQAQREDDPRQKKLLERIAETIKELGVATASEVMRLSGSS